MERQARNTKSRAKMAMTDLEAKDPMKAICAMDDRFSVVPLVLQLHPHPGPPPSMGREQETLALRVNTRPKRLFRQRLTFAQPTLRRSQRVARRAG